MQFLPNPHFVIVAINKEAQKERKEKSGSIFVVSHDESRNLQYGTIVAVGANVPDLFPQAVVGAEAILHWMVESKEKGYKIAEDETNGYYHATACEYNGRANELYGIWDGEKIIPNLDYMFLEKKVSVQEGFENEDYINKATKVSSGGLLVFNDWRETRVDKEEKMHKISAEIEQLSKTKMSAHLAGGIREKEAELNQLSNEINSTYIEPHTVVAVNPEFAAEVESCFGSKIEKGSQVGYLNAATQTTIFFRGIEYVVALSKHFHCPMDWAIKAIREHKKTAVETAVAR